MMNSDEIDVDAMYLASSFLRLAQMEMEKRKVNKKQLAHMVGTSPSYITQLFMSDRLPNWKMLAKIKNALEMEFIILSKDMLSDVVEQELELRKKPWNNALRARLNVIKSGPSIDPGTMEDNKVLAA